MLHQEGVTLGKKKTVFSATEPAQCFLHVPSFIRQLDYSLKGRDQSFFRITAWISVLYFSFLQLKVPPTRDLSAAAAKPTAFLSRHLLAFLLEMIEELCNQTSSVEGLRSQERSGRRQSRGEDSQVVC